MCSNSLLDSLEDLAECVQDILHKSFVSLTCAAGVVVFALTLVLNLYTPHGTPRSLLDGYMNTRAIEGRNNGSIQTRRSSRSQTDYEPDDQTRDIKRIEEDSECSLRTSEKATSSTEPLVISESGSKQKKKWWKRSKTSPESSNKENGKIDRESTHSKIEKDKRKHSKSSIISEFERDKRKQSKSSITSEAEQDKIMQSRSTIMSDAEKDKRKQSKSSIKSEPEKGNRSKRSSKISNVAKKVTSSISVLHKSNSKSLHKTNSRDNEGDNRLDSKMSRNINEINIVYDGENMSQNPSTRIKNDATPIQRLREIENKAIDESILTTTDIKNNNDNNIAKIEENKPTNEVNISKYFSQSKSSLHAETLMDKEKKPIPETESNENKNKDISQTKKPYMNYKQTSRSNIEQITNDKKGSEGMANKLNDSQKENVMPKHYFDEQNNDMLENKQNLFNKIRNNTINEMENAGKKSKSTSLGFVSIKDETETLSPILIKSENLPPKTVENLTPNQQTRDSSSENINTFKDIPDLNTANVRNQLKDNNRNDIAKVHDIIPTGLKSQTNESNLSSTSDVNKNIFTNKTDVNTANEKKQPIANEVHSDKINDISLALAQDALPIRIEGKTTTSATSSMINRNKDKYTDESDVNNATAKEQPLVNEMPEKNKYDTNSLQLEDKTSRPSPSSTTNKNIDDFSNKTDIYSPNVKEQSILNEKPIAIAKAQGSSSIEPEQIPKRPSPSSTNDENKDVFSDKPDIQSSSVKEPSMINEIPMAKTKIRPKRSIELEDNLKRSSPSSTSNKNGDIFSDKPDIYSSSVKEPSMLNKIPMAKTKMQGSKSIELEDKPKRFFPSSTSNRNEDIFSDKPDIKSLSVKEPSMINEIPMAKTKMQGSKSIKLEDKPRRSSPSSTSNRNEDIFSDKPDINSSRVKEPSILNEIPMGKTIIQGSKSIELEDKPKTSTTSSTSNRKRDIVSDKPDFNSSGIKEQSMLNEMRKAKVKKHGSNTNGLVDKTISSPSSTINRNKGFFSDKIDTNGPNIQEQSTANNIPNDNINDISVAKPQVKTNKSLLSFSLDSILKQDKNDTSHQIKQTQQPNVTIEEKLAIGEESLKNSKMSIQCKIANKNKQNTENQIQNGTVSNVSLGKNSDGERSLMDLRKRSRQSTLSAYRDSLLLKRIHDTLYPHQIRSNDQPNLKNEDNYINDEHNYDSIKRNHTVTEDGTDYNIADRIKYNVNVSKERIKPINKEINENLDMKNPPSEHNALEMKRNEEKKNMKTYRNNNPGYCLCRNTQTIVTQTDKSDIISLNRKNAKPEREMRDNRKSQSTTTECPLCKTLLQENRKARLHIQASFRRPLSVQPTTQAPATSSGMSCCSTCCGKPKI